MTDRIEAQIERFAPGFRDLILARAVRTAAGEEAHNPNYVGGDIAVGMQTMWQTVFRPTVQGNPYRPPIRGVSLCSSATPPVPGVHGRCGELAALTALRDVFGIREVPDISPASVRPAALVGATPAPPNPVVQASPVSRTNPTVERRSRVIPITPPQWWLPRTSGRTGKRSTSRRRKRSAAAGARMGERGGFDPQ